VAGAPRSNRFAPGLRRRAIGAAHDRAAPLGGASTTALPLTLTLRDAPADALVGVIVPAGSVPWGCLFFLVIGAAVLLAAVSLHAAAVLGGVGLIVLFGVQNHPRRHVGRLLQDAMGHLAARRAEQAVAAAREALERQTDDEGAHWVAALALLATGRPAEALPHLEQARPMVDRYAEYHHMLGRTLKLLGRDAEAAGAFARGLEFTAYPSREALLREAGGRISD
jgi:hypothetical protein